MSQPKKILFVVTQSEWGGAQRYIFDLATNLPKDQYATSVAAGGTGALHQKLADAGIPSHHLRHVVRQINPIYDTLGLFELISLFHRVRPDVVHLNSSKISILGTIAARLAGVKKIVYTAHGFVFNEPLPTWQKLFYLVTERLTGAFKTDIICIYEGDRQTAIEKHIGKPEQIHVVHNGIPPLAFVNRAESQTALGLPPDRLLIGTIANFYPTKGLPDLLAAARVVADQHPTCLFAIIGDGQQRKQLEALIQELEITGNVLLLGEKDPDVSRYLQAFTIYACSSVKEGFPYALLESMAAGVPIASTNVGGIPEMITTEQTGLLVPPHRPDQLAAAILKLLNDQTLRQTLADAAKTHQRQRCTLALMVEQTAAVYQR
jgi:glycosyltransferase involved in cell wall biosynthesis